MRAICLLLSLSAPALVAACDVWGTSSQLLPGDGATVDGDDGGFTPKDCDLSVTPFNIQELKFDNNSNITTLVGITSGNFDTNALTDIAVVSGEGTSPKNLAIILNIDFTSGSPTPMTTQQNPIASPLAIVSFDMGGTGIRDNLDDLAALTFDGVSPNISLKLNAWKNSSQYGFAPLPGSPYTLNTSMGMIPSGILKAGRFSQDDAIDLVISATANLMMATQFLYLWNGTAMTPAQSPALYSAMTALAVADLDQNGRDDLVIAKAVGTTPPPPGSELYVGLANKGDSEGIFSWTQMGVFPGETFLDLALADLNGDGILDLVSAVNPDSTGPSQIRCWAGIPDGGRWNQFGEFPASLNLDSHYSDLRIQTGDLDGDGKIDVSVLSKFSSTYWFVRNESKTLSIDLAAPISTTVCGSDATRDFFIRDVNQDGLPDIVFACSEIPAGKLVFFLNPCH